MSFILNDLAEVGLGRLLYAAAQPLRVRRALAELRGSQHSMRCSIRARTSATQGIGPRWQSGTAVLAPGLFSFYAEGGHAAVHLQVQAVVETVETRAGDSDGAGPRALAVWQLRLPGATVLWSAHAKVLAEGAGLLRTSPPLSIRESDGLQ